MSNWVQRCMEAEDGAGVEAWAPAVGQRVRVMLSAECNYIVLQKCAIYRLTALPEGSVHSHPVYLDGRSGVVVNINGPDNHGVLIPGHRYKVLMDIPYEWGGVIWPTHMFASCELEAIEEGP